MVHVAGEMQRLNMAIPLLIGGATTSKAHTATKIEPAYQNSASIYVSDASRAVSVAASLLGGQQKYEYYTRSIARSTKPSGTGWKPEDQNKLSLALEDARANAHTINWEPILLQPQNRCRSRSIRFRSQSSYHS